MRHGMGYDGITSQLAASAIDPMQLSRPNSNPSVSFVLSTVRTEEDAQKYIDTSLNASASAFGVGITGSWNQAHSLKFSETTMTTILECHVKQTPVQYESTPTLTQGAREMLQTNPTRFASVYGQYFVAGHVAKASLSAIMTFTAQSKEQLDEMAASIGASKGPVAVNAAVSYVEQASKSRIAVECKWNSIGISPASLSTHPSPTDIRRIFEDHEKMVPSPQTALLQLYSVINPLASLTTPGSEGMDELNAAFREVSTIQRLYSNIRSVEGRRILRLVTMTAEEISNIRPSGTQWQNSLKTHLAALKTHKHKLELCLVREDLISRVMQVQPQGQARYVVYPIHQ